MAGKERYAERRYGQERWDGETEGAMAVPPRSYGLGLQNASATSPGACPTLLERAAEQNAASIP